MLACMRDRKKGVVAHGSGFILVSHVCNNGETLAAKRMRVASAGFALLPVEVLNLVARQLPLESYLALTWVCLDVFVALSTWRRWRISRLAIAPPTLPPGQAIAHMRAHRVALARLGIPKCVQVASRGGHAEMQELYRTSRLAKRGLGESLCSSAREVVDAGAALLKQRTVLRCAATKVEFGDMADAQWTNSKNRLRDARARVTVAVAEVRRPRDQSRVRIGEPEADFTDEKTLEIWVQWASKAAA
tara:strand:+ start:1463 stop:2200 length:738 start_codon:yes stop_codon:yes gene_type:complete